MGTRPVDRSVKAIREESAQLSYKNGRLIEQRRALTKTVKYDKSGKLKEEVFWTSGQGSQRFSYSYNSEGERREHYEESRFPLLAGEVYRPVHAQGIRSHFTYDSRGNRVEETKYRYSVLLGKVTYSYDAAGRRKEETVQDKEGRPLVKRAYDYNVTGDVSGISHFGSGNMREKSRYDGYEYDGNGNWIRRTKSILSKNGTESSFRPTEVTYRTITYW